MAMSEMQKWQKSIESGKRRIAKRKARKEAIATGKYAPYTGYDDEGFPLPDPPYWFLNLQKAWMSNRQLGRERRNKMLDDPKNVTIKQKWDEWCDERVDLGCSDPRKPKRLVGRPKLHPSQKMQPKLKRSDQMRRLLQEHGITIESVGQDEFLIEYPDWEFLPNGRLRYRQESPISVHRFLKDHDLIS